MTIYLLEEYILVAERRATARLHYLERRHNEYGTGRWQALREAVIMARNAMTFAAWEFAAQSLAGKVRDS